MALWRVPVGCAVLLLTALATGDALLLSADFQGSVADGGSWSDRAGDVMSAQMSDEERLHLRDSAKQMFLHTYKAYMDNAYPADELMPLSCGGRWRHIQPSRGDVDDAMGNFSLTLVDSLDTLVLLGELDEFERAVRLVIRDVSFDTDLIVSVFETNIRMLGGLLSGHVLAEQLRNPDTGRLSWYSGQLLAMAEDLGTRLLPAFNTSTGIPHARVNLRHGMDVPALRHSRETCTACGGTLLLELAALSRLAGQPSYERRARRAMDSLWHYRHRQSDLVGTTINVHTGDWVQRDSGVGAGIDSYYEYCLKAYILLGDDSYLMRFNRHYAAVMRYVSHGPLLLDVHMHRPDTVARNFMSALLAFWPGLQVLKGDIEPAIQTHAMLFQVMQKFSLLPEAFTTDFQVHWAHHPLRPELLESTYMLYRATGHHYYLQAGRRMLLNLRRLGWTRCGFAAVQDVRTGQQEDRLDSFVLAETFKYLYLLFADDSDLPVDLNRFIFSTEAHLLPLSLSRSPDIASSQGVSPGSSNASVSPGAVRTRHLSNEARTCANPRLHLATASSSSLRPPLSALLGPAGRSAVGGRGGGFLPVAGRLLRASAFDAGRREHIQLAGRMGVAVSTLDDGRIHLSLSPAAAESEQLAAEGLLFMQEMLELSQQLQQNGSAAAAAAMTCSVWFAASGAAVATQLPAGPAHFGPDLSSAPVAGQLALSEPWHACSGAGSPAEGPEPAAAPVPQFAALQATSGCRTAASCAGRIVLALRGQCMFVDKLRYLQALGARAAIIMDSDEHSSSRTMHGFAMSGDDNDSDITIPSVFLYGEEAAVLLTALKDNPSLFVTLSHNSNTSETATTAVLAGHGRVEIVGASGELRRPLREAGSLYAAADAIQQLSSWLVNLLNTTLTSSVSRLTQQVISPPTGTASRPALRDTATPAVLPVSAVSPPLPNRPAADTPAAAEPPAAADTPAAAETPAAETPAAETPAAADTPAAAETPVAADTPAAAETPAAETPAAAETAAADTAAETPAAESPVTDTAAAAAETSAAETPAAETPAAAETAAADTAAETPAAGSPVTDTFVDPVRRPSGDDPMTTHQQSRDAGSDITGPEAHTEL